MGVVIADPKTTLPRIRVAARSSPLRGGSPCKPRRRFRRLVKPFELKEDSGIAERSALALVARAPEQLALLVLAHLLAPLLDHASQELTSADWLKGRG